MMMPTGAINTMNHGDNFDSNTPFTSLDRLFLKGLLTFIIFITMGNLIYYSRSPRQRYIPGVPIIGGSDPAAVAQNRIRFVHESKSMVLEGYRSTSGGLFCVPTTLGERLMLPVKYLEDLKSAPSSEADLRGTFIEMYEGKYTGFGTRSTLLDRHLRGALNKNLWTVMDHLQDQVKFAFDEVFPSCDDWTEVDILHCMNQIVATLSSHMFGGTALSRNKQWTRASVEYAIDGFIAAQALKQYPEWLKPFAARFLVPAVRKVKQHEETAEGVIVPILTERAKSGTPYTAMDNDLLSWMADDAQGEEKDPRFIANILLKISFAAILTSAAAPVELLYDLCAMPEYIEPLRNEAQANTDSNTGRFLPDTRQGLQNMLKLDSIMKESQRFNPLLWITFERIITKDFHLSDGVIIPGGTTVGVPAHAISQDPSLFPESDKFEGFRFSDQSVVNKSGGIGQGSSSPRSVAWSAAHPENMTSGYGRHACPGRFFASAEIKAIMVYILLNYDFKFPEGQRGRPPSLIFEVQNLPNPAGRILFKRRVM